MSLSFLVKFVNECAEIMGPARFGLSWSPNLEGHILGASEDMTVCHW